MDHEDPMLKWIDIGKIWAFIAPQATSLQLYRPCASQIGAGVQIRPQPGPTFMKRYAARLHPRNSCNYMELLLLIYRLRMDGRLS